MVHAEAESQRGIGFCRQGQWDEAIACFKTALDLEPDRSTVRCNLGFVLLHQGKLDDAAACFRVALATDPDLFQAHNNLGIVFIRQQRWDAASQCFQHVLQLMPDFAEAHCNLGVALKEQGQLQAAADSFQRAIQLQPNLPDAHHNLGLVRVQQQRLDEAIACFERALQINPAYAEAYANLCNALFQAGDLPAMYEAAEAYGQRCGATDGLRADLLLIRAALYLGRRQRALEALKDLETKVYSISPASADAIARDQLAILYPELLFDLPYLRDDGAANARLGQQVARAYFESHQPVLMEVGDRPPQPPLPLRIGIMSKYFNRVSEGWCSRDIVRELLILNPYLYLYATARFKPDDLTEQFRANSCNLFIPPSLSEQIHLEHEQEILDAIETDALDVLIDIDSVMNPVHPKILRHRPAPVCVSWLGFEPPMVSRQHYFMGDWHTLPPEIEPHYYEQLLRLPDSFIAVSGFSCDAVDVAAARQAMGIAGGQVVYLCMSIGLKFSDELAHAHVQILRQVPNSLLLHKGAGDTDKTRVGYSVIRDTYQRECERQGVTFDRIQFLGRTRTEEEHRTIYRIADVLLDSYPFNGVTHTLEALWFQLPTVTLVGEQFYARASYSFMQSVGLTVGVAHSWEEYEAWGVGLGRDRDQRISIQEHLLWAKQPETLASLWNPRQFATDFLAILQSLTCLDRSPTFARKLAPDHG